MCLQINKDDSDSEHLLCVSTLIYSGVYEFYLFQIWSSLLIFLKPVYFIFVRFLQLVNNDNFSFLLLMVSPMGLFTKQNHKQIMIYERWVGWIQHTVCLWLVPVLIRVRNLIQLFFGVWVNYKTEANKIAEWERYYYIGGRGGVRGGSWRSMKPWWCVGGWRGWGGTPACQSVCALQCGERSVRWPRRRPPMGVEDGSRRKSRSPCAVCCD